MVIFKNLRGRTPGPPALRGEWGEGHGEGGGGGRKGREKNFDMGNDQKILSYALNATTQIWK